MSHLPGKFVWFEHVCTDPGRARAFYEPLFGWHVERMPVGDRSYDMILNRNDPIGGLRSALPGMRAQWAPYLSVPSVDGSFAAAIAAGAKPLLAPSDLAPLGRAAAVADPTGAALCLWKGRADDRPDVAGVPLGDWAWNELWTPDASMAVAFYETVIGYTHDAMDMAGGTYYVLKVGDKPRAGVIQAHPPRTAACWLPYVEVADCDAGAARAQELGATACVPPTDVAGVGRFAVLVDPLGAAIGIIRSAGAQGNADESSQART